MRALFDDVAVIHDEDVLRMADGGEPMGDDKARPPLHQPLHRRLDILLGARIDVARRLVENEHGRVGEHGAGDRDELLLPLGDVDGVIREHGIVPRGQFFDEGGDLCLAADALHLLPRSVLAAVAHVFEHAAREQPGILQHHRKGTAQRGARHFGNVLPVDEDAPRLRIVKAHQKVDERRLARARVPHDRDELAALRMQREVVEDGLFGVITEADVLDIHPAFDGDKLLGVLGVGGLRRLFEDAEDALGGGKGGLELAQNVSDLVDGARELARIEHEGGDAAHARDDAVHIHERAEDADERERKIVHEVDRRARDRAVALRLGVGVRRRGVLFFEARKEDLLAAVRFRRLLPRDDLFDKAVELAQLFGAGAEEGLHLVGEPAREQRRERDGDRKHRDKERRSEEHHHKGADDGDDARQNHHDVVRERFAQRVEVVGEHGDDVARLTRVEVGDGQRHELGKEVGADALDDTARKVAQPDRREIG